MNTTVDQIFNYYAHTICLVGKMCAGKDYIGQQLVRHCGYTRLAFADALKQEVADRHGITVDYLNNNKSVYRAELQQHGKDMRKIDPFYWVNKVQEMREKLDGPVVITDCRHVNEAEWGLTKDANSRSIVLMVTVTEIVRRERATALYGEIPDSVWNDVSEKQQDLCPFNFVVPGELPTESIVNVIKKNVFGWVHSGRPILRISGMEGILNDSAAVKDH